MRLFERTGEKYQRETGPPAAALPSSHYRDEQFRSRTLRQRFYRPIIVRNKRVRQTTFIVHKTFDYI